MRWQAMACDGEASAANKAVVGIGCPQVFADARGYVQGVAAAAAARHCRRVDRAAAAGHAQIERQRVVVQRGADAFGVIRGQPRQAAASHNLSR